MQRLESGLTTLQKLEAYQPTWGEYRARAERSTVDTRYGRKVFDGELRESWGAVEKHMNGLLERYFAENTEIEFLMATGAVELPDVFIDNVVNTADVPIRHTDEVYESD